ncbi:MULTISPECIES: fructoselysine 6-kinase [Enterococcus]|uniref:Fructoselysine 6-kinase n=1 Tax=Candidatus Enterococcus murrayae TaxID=2815321 RepID=A0ABS3HIC8_9ENTE|nr:fructoselysine 6-kinase [Enterococcus sp. MJM16]MBO0453200.1 fructoselysine 6-kinase [Enterococcus sp. MJM16]
MKVLGLGDNVVDKYVNLAIMYPGGNALNFAVFAKKLGQDSSFMGVFGSDAEGTHVLSAIKDLEIEYSHSRFQNGENGCARVEIKEGDRIFLGSNEGGVTREHPIQLSQDDRDYLNQFALIHMGLYSHVNHLLEELTEVRGKISYDFSDDFTEEDILRAINKVDFGFFSVSDLSDVETKEFLKKYFSSKNEVLVATRGDKAAIAYDGNQYFEVLPVLREPVDTMAAGDSFLTAFLIHYLKGNDIASAMKCGNEFAGESCMVEGSFGYGVSYE